MYINEIVSSLVFGAIGLISFFVTIIIAEKLTKFSINKKIAYEGNVALAIVLGAIIISLGLIISAAIR